ncbi:hypothetical protein [Zhongshania sp. BJYM1]|uniref:hypothetical protein n=1 Tax=Zhongshania aquatica TaxID=2965069 RepID=UPI0022B4E26B|nr:hypothetical protein [Marortus sp. BJYM1]
MTLKSIPTAAWLVVAGGVALVAAGYYAKKNAVAIGQAVNPADPNNVVYGAVNALGDNYDDGIDNDSFSLGSWFYDFLHPYDGFAYRKDVQALNLPEELY